MGGGGLFQGGVGAGLKGGGGSSPHPPSGAEFLDAPKKIFGVK